MQIGSTARHGGFRLPSPGILIGIVVLLAALVGLGYLVQSRMTAATTTAPLVTAPVTRQDLTASVSATGTVVSTATSKLSFKTAGLVASVAVVVGDQVHPGQILAREDTSDLEPALLQAQANLSANQAKLALLMQGAKPEDVAAAQAQLDASLAKLAQMQAGPSDGDIQASQSALDSAQAKLDHLLNPDSRDVLAARAAVDSAQLKLDSVRAGPTQADIIAAQAALSSAYNARLKDSVAMSNIKDSPSQRPTDQQTVLAAMVVDDLNIKVAQAKLDQLLAQPTQADLSAAELTLQQAQQKLDVLMNPTDADVIAARSGVDQARNALTLKQSPFSDADFLGQQQAIKSAQANLATKRQPYQDSDILSAQAAVLQSQAALATAQANLNGATVVAPFEGVVSAVSMNVGETAVTGATNPSSITVVDPSQLRIDVQVDESDISNLAVGQPATLSFDAIPGRTIPGKVIAVAPSGTLTQGVVGYPVAIQLQNPRGVRAGMTATAQIEYQRKNAVLTVPNRAIVRQGRDRFVDVQTPSTETQRKKVEVGMANDEATEITSGVNEGDAVIIPQTAARASVPGGAGAAGLGAIGGGRPPGGTFIAPAP